MPVAYCIDQWQSVLFARERDLIHRSIELMAQYGAKELASAFRTVRGNTLQIAREIPEEQYDFVAAPGVRSVSQLLRHIAYADMIYYDFHRDKHIDTLKGYDFGAMIGRSMAEETKPLDKAGV